MRTKQRSHATHLPKIETFPSFMTLTTVVGVLSAVSSVAALQNGVGKLPGKLVDPLSRLRSGADSYQVMGYNGR